MVEGKLSYYLDIIELALICSVAFLIPVYVWSTPIIIAVLGLLFLFAHSELPLSAAVTGGVSAL